MSEFTQGLEKSAAESISARRKDPKVNSLQGQYCVETDGKIINGRFYPSIKTFRRSQPVSETGFPKDRLGDTGVGRFEFQNTQRRVF